MTGAGPWSNHIQCNKTNVTRRQAHQGTLGEEGALTFYKLEADGLQLATVCKGTSEYDPRMYCLSECEGRIWHPEPNLGSLKPEDQERPTLVAVALPPLQADA